MLMFRKTFVALVVVFIALLTIVCPVESMAQVKVKRSKLTAMVDGEHCYIHTVRRKETIYSLAAAYGVSQNDILNKNPLAERGIKVGQTLAIPFVSKSQNDVTTTVEQKKEGEVKPSANRNNGDRQPTVVNDEEFVQLPPLADSVELNAVDTVNLAIDSIFTQLPTEFGLTKVVSRNRPLQVVMLLPFGASDNLDNNFAEFYRGALMGFENLANRGVDIDLRVVSTNNSIDKIREIVLSGELSDANLIIGPVYPSQFELVAPYASKERIPIISPLGTAGNAVNPFVVEVAPVDAGRWDKVAPLLRHENSNVIVIEHQTQQDGTSLNQLSKYIPTTAQRVSYAGKSTSVSVLSNPLVRDKNNVIVVPIGSEIAVEEILSRYSSINATSRYQITVVGTPRWARFERLNLDLFFKLSVTYPTSYFFDRSSPVVSPMYEQYVKRFFALPTLYTMRGYDVATIFGTLLYENRERMMFELIRDTPISLQTPYLFEQDSDNGKIFNVDWALVQYLPNYNIEVK